MTSHIGDNPRKGGSRSHLKKDVKKDHDVFHIPISSGIGSQKDANLQEDTAIVKTEAQESEKEGTDIEEEKEQEMQQEKPESSSATREKEETKGAKDEEIRELQERLKRISAEFENFRRRKEEEVVSARKYASERIIVDLLPVMDNFERALTAAQSVPGAESLLEGVRMIYRQMKQVLEKEGLVEIEAQGQVFDPAFHEAMMVVENNELPDETIVEELQKGYRLKDRVVRASMVKVSRKA